MMQKLQWIFTLSTEEECDVILQAGDFFDSPDQSNKAEITVMDMILNSRCPLITVFGQHDCAYRNRDNTALQKFVVGEFLHIAGAEPFPIEDVHIYGASWEEEIPKVQDPEMTNVLIIHRMVTESGPEWPGQEGYITAKNLLRQCKDYDLVLTGDNHKAFTGGKQFGNLLLNCGSLTRATVAQREHQPHVYIVNTDTGTWEKYFVPIPPIEEVMDLQTADEIKEKNEALEAFMAGLVQDNEVQLSFEENLRQLMIQNQTTENVCAYVHKFLAGRENE
jgi:DNA repair exonuclease SbcCD nuclease subunit